MKKSGKTKQSKKSKPLPKKNIPKKSKPKKEIDLSEEEPEFSSENEYMNYVGVKNEMKNDIQENFDEPFTYLMGNADNIITKSTYTKIEYENGKPVNEEHYQAESVNHKDKKGHNIAEKKEKYKNEKAGIEKISHQRLMDGEKKEKYKNEKAGIEKISHQRLMDGKGTKVIKKINLKSGDKEEHNIYKGIKEKNVKDFNKKYNTLKERVKLDEMFEEVKLLGRKRNLEQGKVLLLGDGNENKEIKEKEEKKDNKENKSKKEKSEKKVKKEDKKEKEKIKEKKGKKEEEKTKNVSKSKSKSKNKNKKNKK